MFTSQPQTLTVKEAARAIALGQLRRGTRIAGTIRWKDIAGVERLPGSWSCYSLDLTGAPIKTLMSRIEVRFRLCLRNCTDLVELPPGLSAGSIDLSGCTSLKRLPERIDTYFLDISDCPQLRSWPEAGNLRIGRLRAQNCTGLTYLPSWMTRISQLDLRGCSGIEALPDGMEVSSWLDLAGTGIRGLPASMAGTPLRWRGVRIDERTAFQPELITAKEVLAERNAEVRRVKLERMGLERFVAEARPEILDEDVDRGGARQLLRVELDGDEPLVCVLVGCPSTGRRYALRVPPDMATCRQAVAWTAGFDNPDEYRPVVET